MTQIIFISVFLIIINTLGQIFLKKAADKNTKRLYFLIFGYSLFLMAIFVSYYLMKIMELKYFTVIMSLIYITVLLSSVYIFKESLNKYKIIGTSLVFFGIVIFIGG